jgi:hypothetical protein
MLNGKEHNDESLCHPGKMLGGASGVCGAELQAGAALPARQTPRTATGDLGGIKTSVAAIAQSSAVGFPELICSSESKLFAARNPLKPGPIPV